MPLIRMSDVASEPVDWLWKNRIPRGSITLLDGDPGIGKSTLVRYIASAISAGRTLPGNDQVVTGDVLLLGEEDGLGETVRPRLVAMNADISRIHALQGEVLTLAHNLARLEEVIVECGAVLVVIDPLSSFLGVSSEREQAVRHALMPVAKLAERLNVAVLAIRHLTKSRSAALHAGLGSVAIGAVARSALLLGRDPMEAGVAVLAHFKNSFGPPSPSLRLRLEGERVGLDGVSSLNANDLVKSHGRALHDAILFLQDALSMGAVRSDRIAKLASGANVTRATLREAKDVLAVESVKTGGFPSTWHWRLPDDERFAPEGVVDATSGPFLGEGAARIGPMFEEHLRGTSPTGDDPSAPPAPSPRPTALLPAVSLKAAPTPPEPPFKEGTEQTIDAVSALRVEEVTAHVEDGSRPQVLPVDEAVPVVGQSNVEAIPPGEEPVEPEKGPPVDGASVPWGCGLSPAGVSIEASGVALASDVVSPAEVGVADTIAAATSPGTPLSGKLPPSVTSAVVRQFPRKKPLTALQRGSLKLLEADRPDVNERKAFLMEAGLFQHMCKRVRCLYVQGTLDALSPYLEDSAEGQLSLSAAGLDILYQQEPQSDSAEQGEPQSSEAVGHPDPMDALVHDLLD